jgi:hypothetical protein
MSWSEGNPVMGQMQNARSDCAVLKYNPYVLVCCQLFDRSPVCSGPL